MPIDDRIERDLLPFVRQPSRYIGGEVNQIRKDWDDCDLRIALGMPEIYSIASSSLALQIIYHIVNSIPHVLCERVFCPWHDAADRMREVGIELFSLESRRPVRDFDILALSIPYEALYSNLLEMLDLAGLPLHASDRTQSDPLVLVGGSQADNPEPIADFIDMAVVGDAEIALPPLIQLCMELKRQRLDRKDMLHQLARSFDWLYVPSLYLPGYDRSGQITSIKPLHDDLPMPIQRACVQDLDTSPFPTSPIVPLGQVVHEKINIEIMRGCPHNCRFCQAGHTRRPMRLRSVDRIVALAEETYKNTGLLEISLCSLSSADYPDLLSLAQKLNSRFAPKGVSIALPSLRIDKQLQMVAVQTSQVRKGPLTIAVEAASESLRAVLGKNTDIQQLFPAVQEAFKAGWHRVKLYFLAGLPTETDEDLRAIGTLAGQIANLREQLGKPAANVTVSVAYLVPKPHTPFQWLGQADRDYFLHARGVIRDSLRPYRTVKAKFHHVDRSILEAILSRGDRRLGAAIEHAWRAGARFDAWQECFQFDRYARALEACGLDPAFYANRQYHSQQMLPWQHIRAGKPFDLLWNQYRQALAMR